MKTIRKWLRKWLGIEDIYKTTNHNIDFFEDRQDEWYAELKESIVRLDDVIREHKSKQEFDFADMLDVYVNKDIKDNERRIDRIEQCIYALSISDDVKATDVKALVKDLAHQMYGERAARGDDSADIPEDWNYDEYGRPFKYIDEDEVPF